MEREQNSVQLFNDKVIQCYLEVILHWGGTKKHKNKIIRSYPYIVLYNTCNYNCSYNYKCNTKKQEDYNKPMCVLYLNIVSTVIEEPYKQDGAHWLQIECAHWFSKFYLPMSALYLNFNQLQLVTTIQCKMFTKRTPKCHLLRTANNRVLTVYNVQYTEQCIVQCTLYKVQYSTVFVQCICIVIVHARRTSNLTKMFILLTFRIIHYIHHQKSRSGGSIRTSRSRFLMMDIVYNPKR